MSFRWQRILSIPVFGTSTVLQRACLHYLTHVYFETHSIILPHPPRLQNERGLAMDQATSHQFFIAKVQVQFQTNTHGIRSTQSDNGMGFSPGSSVVPCRYYSTNAALPFLCHRREIIWYRQYETHLNQKRRPENLIVAHRFYKMPGTAIPFYT